MRHPVHDRWTTTPGHGSRVRLWKWELSKWNKIEHRLFSYISTNWRGQPLVSLAAIVSLIASTKTKTGLHV